MRRGVLGALVVAIVVPLATALAILPSQVRASDFSSAANHICATMAKNSPTPPIPVQATARQWLRFLVPLQIDFRAGISQLAKLTPPARLRGHFLRFVKAGRDFVAALPPLIMLARQGKAHAVLHAFKALPDYGAISRREAVAMGLKQCAG